MNALYKALHREMINAWEICINRKLPYLQQIECYYEVCVKSWGSVKAIAIHHSFTTVAEEIEFFKILKPSFTSEIEYFSLVYHAELFKPHPYEKLMNFYCREAKRFDRFVEENSAFFNYYKSGRTDNDYEYFTLTDEDHINFSDCKIYDMYGSVVSRYDTHVSTIISLEKYRDYILQQIENLNGSCPN